MKINRILVSILITSTMIWGCGDGSNNSGEQSDRVDLFYDLDSFFSSRIDQLKEDSSFLIKNVVYSDTSITSQKDTFSYDKEFKPFYDVRIPRLVWENDYELNLDTLAPDEDGRSIVIHHYIAKDSTSELKQFVLHTSEGKIQAVHLNYKRENMLTDSEQLVIWKETPDGVLYKIRGKQKTKFYGEEVYQIEGKVTVSSKKNNQYI